MTCKNLCFVAAASPQKPRNIVTLEKMLTIKIIIFRIRNILLTILVMCMFIFAYHRDDYPKLSEDPTRVRMLVNSFMFKVEIFLVVG